MQLPCMAYLKQKIPPAAAAAAVVELPWLLAAAAEGVGSAAQPELHWRWLLLRPWLSPRHVVDNEPTELDHVDAEAAAVDWPVPSLAAVVDSALRLGWREQLLVHVHSLVLCIPPLGLGRYIATQRTQLR